MSLQNPFAKPVPKQNTEKSKQVVKKDSTRENVKKQLINALEKNKDNTIKDLKFTSEQIAIEIEEEVFKQNDESSKNRGYRDKIRKLEMRIKGMRNNHIRDILKKGLLSVNEFCNLDEKELNNENFFKKFLESEKPSNGDNQAGNHPPSSENLNSKKFGNMPKIIKPPPRNMIPSIRPIIPKPIIPSNIQEKKIVDENEKNEDINKKEKSEDINDIEISKENKNNEPIKKEIIFNNNINDNIEKPEPKKAEEPKVEFIKEKEPINNKNIEENNDEKIGDIKIEQPEPLLLNGENNINVENINKNDFDDINDNININEEEKKISEKNENLMKNIEKKNTNLSLDRLKATLKAAKSTKNIHKKKKNPKTNPDEKKDINDNKENKDSKEHKKSNEIKNNEDEKINKDIKVDDNNIFDNKNNDKEKEYKKQDNEKVENIENNLDKIKNPSLSI